MSKPSKKPSKTITPDEFRAARKAEGITLAAWARARGINPRKATLVLNGVLKGDYGEAHKIAVAMGLKPAPPASSEQYAA